MTDVNLNSLRNQPDERGRFGMHGGRFVAETLMPLILKVEAAYKSATTDANFQRELEYYQTHYVGRPSPLYFAERMTAHFGGAKLYLKRDELNHTGAHKINNVLGQALLAKRMGKTKIIAETGAGQHGVATATAGFAEVAATATGFAAAVAGFAAATATGFAAAVAVAVAGFAAAA